MAGCGCCGCDAQQQDWQFDPLLAPSIDTDGLNKDGASPLPAILSIVPLHQSGCPVEVLPPQFW